MLETINRKYIIVVSNINLNKTYRKNFMKSIKTIQKPRLSINSFSEFNHATSTRKENIVKENKYPKDGGGFGKYRSRLVKKEIHEYICTQNSNLLKKAKRAIEQRQIT